MKEHDVLAMGAMLDRLAEGERASAGVDLEARVAARTTGLVSAGARTIRIGGGVGAWAMRVAAAVVIAGGAIAAFTARHTGARADGIASIADLERAWSQAEDREWSTLDARIRDLADEAERLDGWTESVFDEGAM